MKLLPLLLILATAAGARADLPRFLAQGIEAAGASFKPVGAQDREALLGATAALLSKHVTFRPDGTASSFQSTGNTRRAVEWRRLVVRGFTVQPVNEANRLNGITRRFLVSLGCDAHRTWDTKANRWGEWHGFANPMFPSAFVFEWKNNAWTVRETSRLEFFTPGPGPSISAPRTPSMTPGGKDADLPPGMRRAGS